MSLTMRYLMLQPRQEGPPGEQLPPGDPTVGVAQNVQVIIGVAAFSMALATISVFLRFGFRWTSKLPWRWDDWTIVIALLFSNADAVCYLWAIQYGFGQHIYILQPTMIMEFFKIVFVTFIFYGCSVTFVKLSVLLFYNRIFPQNNFRKWLIVLAVASIIWWILITLVSVLQCIPVQKIWNPEIPGHCINYLNLYIAIQVLNIVLDIVIIVLPIRAVLRLQMSMANKVSVAGTFALGGLSVVFAIIRLAILVKDQTQTDITFAPETANWSLVEPAFEIFCACLPCFTPVLRLGRWVSKTATERSKANQSKNLYGSNQSWPTKGMQSGHTATVNSTVNSTMRSAHHDPHAFDRYIDLKDMNATMRSHDGMSTVRSPDGASTLRSHDGMSVHRTPSDEQRLPIQRPDDRAFCAGCRARLRCEACGGVP